MTDETREPEEAENKVLTTWPQADMQRVKRITSELMQLSAVEFLYVKSFLHHVESVELWDGNKS